MSVGFSGTAGTLTSRQSAALRKELTALRADHHVFHHGDCVGADTVADGIAHELGYRIIVHPPDDSKARAFCGQPPFPTRRDTYVWEPQPYLTRNMDIAVYSDVLVACPPGEEVRRGPGGGTWSTVRYARKVGCTIVLLMPDGERRVEP